MESGTVRRIRRGGTWMRSVLALLIVCGLAAAVQAGVSEEVRIVEPLEAFAGEYPWTQSGWADADTDPEGVQYTPGVTEGAGPDGEGAVVAHLHFKPGGYSQGVLHHERGGDWTGRDELSVRLKQVGDGGGVTVKAKVI